MRGYGSLTTPSRGLSLVLSSHQSGLPMEPSLASYFVVLVRALPFLGLNLLVQRMGVEWLRGELVVQGQCLSGT